MADIKLGVVGEAMLKKIKQQQKKLTQEQIQYLASKGYVPRGIGYINSATGKFASDDEIQGVVKTMPEKEGVAEKVGTEGPKNTINAAPQKDGDPVYSVVKSISESISQFTDIIIERPSREARKKGAAEVVEDDKLNSMKEDTESTFNKIFKVILGWGFFGSTILMPIIDLVKSLYKAVTDFTSKVIKVVKESVTHFFKTTVSDFFEDIKDFFTVDIPHQLSKLMDVFGDAVSWFLKMPERIILSIQDYGLKFAESMVDKFSPWLEMVGINSGKVKEDIDKRQANLAKKEEAAAVQKKKDDAERAKELAARAEKQKQFEKEKRALEESKGKERDARDIKLAQEKRDREEKERLSKQEAERVEAKKREVEPIPQPYAEPRPTAPAAPVPAPAAPQQPAKPEPTPSKPSGGGTAELGELSAKYESGNKGSAAIGWDSTGGTSYGKYQIASKTGTFDNFLKFISKQNPELYAKLSIFKPTNTGKKTGDLPDAWISAAKSGLLGDSEHQFIKASHYDIAFNAIKNSELKGMISSSKALKEVLWSSAVQHGPHGAKGIFEKIFRKGMSVAETIQAIYRERATRFTSSTAQIKESAKKRFIDEEGKAIALAGPSAMQQSGTQVASATQAADIKPPKSQGQTATAQASAQPSKNQGTKEKGTNVASAPNSSGVTNGYKAYFATS